MTIILPNYPSITFLPRAWSYKFKFLGWGAPGNQLSAGQRFVYSKSTVTDGSEGVRAYSTYDSCLIIQFIIYKAGKAHILYTHLGRTESKRHQLSFHTSITSTGRRQRVFLVAIFTSLWTGLHSAHIVNNRSGCPWLFGFSDQWNVLSLYVIHGTKMPG